MIPLPEIRARVKAKVADFEYVRGATALANAVERQQFAGNECYLVVEQKLAGRNTLTNAVSQQVTVTIAVMYWLRDVSDTTGQAVSDKNEQINDALADALLCWTPDSEKYSNFEYAGGGIVQLDVGAALYAEKFTTQLIVRKVTAS